jgi:pimeloyl-ACP methyl ester carboxylesterase
VPAFLSVRNPIPYYAPLLLGFYGRIAPRQAARLLADLISRPGGQNPTQPWELAHGTDGKAIELRTGLKARSWGESGPLVLALHGWRGRTTQFRPLAAMLLERRMRTVALELPGHGTSSGDSATPRLIGELLLESSASPARCMRRSGIPSAVRRLAPPWSTASAPSAS